MYASASEGEKRALGNVGELLAGSMGDEDDQKPAPMELGGAMKGVATLSEAEARGPR